MGSSSLNSQNKKAMSTGDFMSADASDDSLSKETRGTIMTNQANYRIAQETNAMNKSIADANLDFQREQQAYERDLQQQMFQREDNAIQRQVADSRAAGVSPLANLSGAASSGVVANTTTPQSGYQAQGATMQNGAFGDRSDEVLAKLQGVSQIIGTINQAASTLNELQNGASSREAQSIANLLSQQQLSFNENSVNDRLDAIKLSNAALRANTWKTWYQGANEYGKAQDFAERRHEREKYGILPSDSERTREIKKLISFLMPSDRGSQKYTKRFGDGPSVDYNMPYSFDRKMLNDFAKKYLDVDVDGLQEKGTDWLAETTRNTLGKALKGIISATSDDISDTFTDDEKNYYDNNPAAGGVRYLGEWWKKKFGKNKNNASVSTGGK